MGTQTLEEKAQQHNEDEESSKSGCRSPLRAQGWQSIEQVPALRQLCPTQLTHSCHLEPGGEFAQSKIPPPNILGRNLKLLAEISSSPRISPPPIHFGLCCPVKKSPAPNPSSPQAYETAVAYFPIYTQLLKPVKYLLAKHVPPEQVPALICDSNYEEVVYMERRHWRRNWLHWTLITLTSTRGVAHPNARHFGPLASGPTFLSFLGVESNDNNFCVRNCANMKSNALCCSNQGLASSCQFDQNFSKWASLSRPLQKLCKHIFHQITTPPRSSPLVPIDAFIKIYAILQTGLGMEGVLHM